jgi:predicted RNA binding protein YcfA (HicA-like mRNA interferase family)
MRIPRDLSGEQLAILLKKYGYQFSKQVGSHMRYTTQLNGEHHLTVPKHNPLRIGTLNNILNDVASHLDMPKDVLMKDLFL